MISYIFSFFFIIGIGYGIINNSLESTDLINASNNAIKMIFNIIPVTCLWMGIMNIAKESGLIKKITKVISPLISLIFPEIPRNSECFSYIGTNIIMNMLGLGSAATPFGLKAMQEMQKINSKKDTASKSMITFLVMNTAAFTIMPSTIIGIRVMHGSVNATSIVGYVIITSFLSCLFGILLDKLLSKVIK